MNKNPGLRWCVKHVVGLVTARDLASLERNYTADLSQWSGSTGDFFRRVKFTLGVTLVPLKMAAYIGCLPPKNFAPLRIDTSLCHFSLHIWALILTGCCVNPSRIHFYGASFSSETFHCYFFIMSATLHSDWVKKDVTGLKVACIGAGMYICTALSLDQRSKSTVLHMCSTCAHPVFPL